MSENPGRRRLRRTRFVASALPRLDDRPPPRWTGVPVERDPVTGRLLRGDPTGRADKGRTHGSAARRGALLGAGGVAVVAAVVLGVWALGGGIGGQPTPAASATAAPSPTELPASQGEPTTAPTAGQTTAATTTDPTTTSTTTTTPPPPAAPAAPSGLAATPVSETAIQLTWLDRSTDESGFEITDGAVSRTVPAGAQEYLWDGLTGGQQVCFRIRAVGEAGVSVWHPDGAGVCATTPAPQVSPVDLRVTDVTLLATDPVCTDSFPAFDASFANGGVDASGPFTLRWIIDGDPVSDDEHGGLPGGGTDVRAFVLQGVSTGVHELAVVVDPDGQVAESDEGNNSRVLTFTAEDCID